MTTTLPRIKYKTVIRCRILWGGSARQDSKVSRKLYSPQQALRVLKRLKRFGIEAYADKTMVKEAVQGELEAKARRNIEAAQKHADLAQMKSSADLCIEDAVKLFNKKEFELAASRAKDSLRYSVGILSPVYQNA